MSQSSSKSKDGVISLSPKKSSKYAIEISGVSKEFGTVHALENVDLRIPTGQIFGFLGPNGAGKTTMIRCLMDYIRPSQGSMAILGKDAHADSAELKSLVGYLSSDMQLYPNWTAKTHIDFVASIEGYGRSQELIKSFNLDLHKKVRKLSSGNKQKLAIILAFIGNPKVLIMDEPTRGLDPLLQNQLYDLLREFASDGGTVFLSSHNLAEVQQLCHGVAVIKEGKIVSSQTMSEILKINIHNITAFSKSGFDHKDFNIDGVEIVSSGKREIKLKVKGELNQGVKALSKYDLTSLEINHANLEDVFMEYY